MKEIFYEIIEWMESNNIHALFCFHDIKIMHLYTIHYNGLVFTRKNTDRRITVKIKTKNEIEFEGTRAEHMRK